MTRLNLVLRFAIAFSLFTLSLFAAVGGIFYLQGRMNIAKGMMLSLSPHQMWLDAFMILGFMVLGGMALMIWMKKIVVNPTNRLKEGAKRLQQGDLNARLSEPSVLELREVAQGFNEMATSLQEKDALLKAYALELEQKVMERAEAQMASEAELRAVLAAMTDVIIVLDDQANILRVVPTNPKELDVELSSRVGHNLSEFIPAERFGIYLTRIQQALTSRQPVHFEYAMPGLQGVAWFAATISPLRGHQVLWVARDITAHKLIESERQQATQKLEQLVEERTEQLATSNRALEEEIQERRIVEDDLRRTETRYRMLVEQIPAVTYIASIESDESLYYSPQIQEMSGYPSEAWVISGDLWQNSLHPEDRERVLTEVNLSRQTGVDFRTEYRLIRRDGQVIWVQDTASVISDEEGRPLYLQGLQFDITERKKNEERTRQDADRAELLASISRELADIYMDYLPALNAAVNALIGLVGDVGTLWLLSEDGTTLRPYACHTRNNQDEEAWQDRVLSSGHQSEPCCHSAQVMESGQPLMLESEDGAPIPSADAPWLEYSQVYSLMCVPLRAQGRMMGTLELMRLQPEAAYGEADLAFVQNIADRIALAVVNSQLFNENVRRKHELEIRVDERTAELREVNFRLQEELEEHTRTENELYQSRQMLQAVLDHIPQRIFWKDSQCRYLGCNLQFAHDARAQHPAEIIGKTDFELAWRDLAEHFLADDREVIESNRAKLNHEEYQILPDGTRRWLRANKLPLRDRDGNVIGVLGVYEDVTAIKQAETELKIKDHALRSAINGFLIADLNGQVSYVNPSFLELTRYESEAEVIGRHVVGFFAEEEEARGLLATLRRYANWRGELEVLRKDGSTFSAELFFNTVLDEDDQPIYLSGSLIDITERKEAEALVIKQTRELARSNAELEQFAYVASHDLQEPLRMVASYTQLLARRYQGMLGEDADEFIAFAVDGATRMQRLINDLLTYSRVTTKAKPFENTNLNDVLWQVMANLQVAIDESAATITSDPLPEIMADGLQMAQLFQNLIGNAIKFHSQEPPKVHISAEQQDGTWLFSVKDNGIGIDPQFAERIFVIFQRLHDRNEYPGTGIGLAICRKIIERHGGRIWVTSESGQGSTFFFTIPVHPFQGETV